MPFEGLRSLVLVGKVLKIRVIWNRGTGGKCKFLPMGCLLLTSAYCPARGFFLSVLNVDFVALEG